MNAPCVYDKLMTEQGYAVISLIEREVLWTKTQFSNICTN